MRIEKIVGPSILGVVIAMLPGAALAAQVLGFVLAVAPALAAAVHAAGPEPGPATRDVPPGAGAAAAPRRSRP